MEPSLKYARIERERRFLLDRFPSDVAVVRTRRIVDRYIEGTRLRLREVTEEGVATQWKLTQKIPTPGSGAQQGFLTTIYLSADEFGVLAQLPAKELRKTRHSVPPFGIDVFEGELEGLVLAETEFDSAEAAASITLPCWIRREVSTDPRFAGGSLVCASRKDLQEWIK